MQTTQQLPTNWRAPKSSLPTHDRMAGSRCDNADPVAVTTRIPVAS